MKKNLLFVLLLIVSAASFRTAWARECKDYSGRDYDEREHDLGHLSFKDDCTSIGAKTFNYYQGISSVSFPDGLVEIGNEAFDQGGFVTFDLSNTSITSIGNNAFTGIANPSTIKVKKGSKAHELLGVNGTSSKTGDHIKSQYASEYTTLIVLDPSAPKSKSGNFSGREDAIRLVPLPEDEFGSYELDPVTGEKNYLLFHTYDICMNFLNNDALCSGYERCYHK